MSGIANLECNVALAVVTGPLGDILARHVLADEALVADSLLGELGRVHPHLLRSSLSEPIPTQPCQLYKCSRTENR